MTRSRAEDPAFFDKEEALLSVGTAWDTDYDERDSLSRRFAADGMARGLALGALLLAALAGSGFGQLHQSVQWHAVVALGLLAVGGGWDPAWWGATGARVRGGPGVALALVVAFVILPALPWVASTPAAIAPGLLFALLLAVAWPFQSSTEGPLACARTGAALVTYAALLLWPVMQLSPLPSPAAGGAALAAAAAAFFVLAGSPDRWPAAVNPVLLRRLGILALLSALFSPSLSASAWYTGLGATVVCAALMRVRPAGTVGRETPWRLLLGIVAIHLWSAAFTRVVSFDLRAGPQMASAALEYLAVALVAARWSRARLDSLARHRMRVRPPAVVPLFDRAQHHALESWVE